MHALPLERVRETVHRLFIGTPGTGLRKEDEQKCRELAGLLPYLARVKKGAHVVDAAAGKASVGLVAAELLDIGQLTVVERDPKRIEACREAARRLTRAVPVDVREADVGDAAAWPEAPDVVVALHACGAASDAVIDAAIACRTRQLLLAPCCYGANIPFRARALDAVREMGFVDEGLIQRRMAALLVDAERTLRLEANGYETEHEEFVAATVTPHNMLFRARRTMSEVRMARAKARLSALR